MVTLSHEEKLGCFSRQRSGYLLLPRPTPWHEVAYRGGDRVFPLTVLWVVWVTVGAAFAGCCVGWACGHLET